LLIDPIAPIASAPAAQRFNWDVTGNPTGFSHVFDRDHGTGFPNPSEAHVHRLKYTHHARDPIAGQALGTKCTDRSQPHLLTSEGEPGPSLDDMRKAPSAPVETSRAA
jgi:hypothetical protein